MKPCLKPRLKPRPKSCPKSWMIVAILLMTAMPASADFYRYIDANGAVRYTDDLNQVPPDQREEVPNYEESKTTVTTPAQTANPSTEPAPATPKTDEPPVTEADLDQQRASLKDRKQELDRSYEEIRKERQDLIATSKYTTSKARAKEIMDRKAALEKKIRQYEDARKKYEADVTAYNQKVDDFMRQISDEKERAEKRASMDALYEDLAPKSDSSPD